MEKQIWIYNPTYGSVQVKDLTEKPLDEAHVWEQSYASSDRPLKESEVKLLEQGKMGYYPDEFYLVGKLVSKKLVSIHQRQVKAFSLVNHNGPAVDWKDKCGNKRTQLSINFVPGPMVDIINQATNFQAANALFEIMCAGTSRTYHERKNFKKHARKFGWDLVMAVRKYANFPDMKNKVPWLHKGFSEKTRPSFEVKPVQRGILEFAKGGQGGLTTTETFKVT